MDAFQEEPTTALLLLSLSFPVGGMGHRPDLLQEAP